jgi:NTE family protein
MYRLRTDYWDFMRWTSFYETFPLLTTLEAHVDFNKLKPDSLDPLRNGRTARLILTATNVFTGKLEKFDSDKMQITPEHVRASGSLPPSFPATKTTAPPGSGGTEHLYWDGGLFDNTPLSMVIEALQDSGDADKRLYVITLFPSATAAAPKNLHEVFSRMMTLAFSNKMAKDMKRARQTTELIKFGIELDKMIDEHPELSPLRELPGYKVLKDFQAPIKIVEIMNPTVGGASDFSAEGIERRRESGYQSTSAALEANN